MLLQYCYLWNKWRNTLFILYYYNAAAAAAWSTLQRTPQHFVLLLSRASFSLFTFLKQCTVKCSSEKAMNVYNFKRGVNRMWSWPTVIHTFQHQQQCYRIYCCPRPLFVQSITHAFHRTSARRNKKRKKVSGNLKTSQYVRAGNREIDFFNTASSEYILFYMCTLIETM